MASRKAEHLSRIRAYLQSKGAEQAGDAEWLALCEMLAPISGHALRALLRESGLALAPFVEGVRQQSFEELERTLIALEAEYSQGDRTRRRQIREIVITAKDHARMASRRARDEGVRARKAEMVEWMLVWLENPGVFPVWVGLRKQAAPLAFPGGK